MSPGLVLPPQPPNRYAGPFLAVAGAGFTVKPMVFQCFSGPLLITPMFFNDLLDPIYKTIAFLTLFWTLSIKPMLFEHFFGVLDPNEPFKESFIGS